MRKRTFGQNSKPTNPRPSTPPPPQPKSCCADAYTRGYGKGFSDAIKQYGINKEDHQ